MSIRGLVDTFNLKSVRLWGKIMGTERNYIVVEAEVREGAVDNETVDSVEDDIGNKGAKTNGLAPLSKEIKAGVNRYTYYVCNSSSFNLQSWTAMEQTSRRYPRTLAGKPQYLQVVYWESFKAGIISQ